MLLPPASTAQLWMFLVLPMAFRWIIPEPKQNVWVTLEKTLQQDNLCLAMGDLSDPLALCLLGIPLMARDHPLTGKKPNPVDTWG